MPYVRVEYSSNIDTDLDVPGLLDALYLAIVATGVFPIAGIRLRAYGCDDYLVGDRNSANCFVHVSLEMGHGRDIEIRRTAGTAIFAALTTYLKPIFESRPMGISMQMHELHPELNFKQNNMHMPGMAG